MLAPIGGLAVLGAALMVWVALDVRRASDGGLITADPPPDLDTVAYITAGPGFDRIYVQRARQGARPTQIALVSADFGLHARGSVSPDGSVAVLFHANGQTGRAVVSVINLRTLAISNVAEPGFSEPIDYLTSVAWNSNGQTIAVTRSGDPGEGGLVTASLVEIDLFTGMERIVATFDSVFDAAPVGYANGALYAVSIDQSGSVLHRLEGETQTKIAELSVGRTRGWILDPDGVRLAYLDVIGAGAGRAVIARILLLATGEITAIPGDDDHVGIVWRAGAELPDVGGPGGSLFLDGAETAIVVPIAWDPQGTRLLASVADEEGDDGGLALEVISADSRLRLAGDGVSALGWVIDAD